MSEKRAFFFKTMVVLLLVFMFLPLTAADAAIQPMGGQRIDYGQLKATDIFMYDVKNWNDLSIPVRAHASVMGGNVSIASIHEIFQEKEAVASVVQKAHNAGVKYVSHITMDFPHIEETPGYESFFALDINNNKIRVDDPFLEGHVFRRYSVYHQGYQDALVEYLKLGVDCGADGLFNDDYYSSFEILKKGSDGDFSPAALARFREYLKTKYGKDKLKKAGINNIDTFDYRLYIISNHYGLYRTNRMEVPFFLDFCSFHMKSVKQFWADVISRVKAYGKEKGRDILWATNLPEGASDIRNSSVGTFCAFEATDFFMNDNTFGLPPKARSIPYYKVFRSLGKPVDLIRSFTDAAPILERKDAGNLIKIYTGEAYSQGGFTNIPFNDMYRGTNGEKLAGVDNATIYGGEAMKDLYSYYDFIHGNALLYEDCESIADIAVLYSFHSINSEYVDIVMADKGGIKKPYTESFYGFSELLLDSHEQYDVFFLPDDDYIKDRTTEAALQKYKALVIPKIKGLTDKQADMLTAYVKNGGIIISPGVFYGDGVTSKEKTFAGYFKNSAKKYGKGSFVGIGQDAGALYLQNNKPVQQISNFKNTVKKLYKKQISTNADGNIAVTSNRSHKANAQIIHLINYNYDLKGMKFSQKNSINLQVSVDKSLSGKKLSVVFQSPDIKSPIELKYTQKNGQLDFSVPKLTAYGVVTISEAGRLEALKTVEELNGQLKDCEDSLDSQYFKEQYERLWELLEKGEYVSAGKRSQELKEELAEAYLKWKTGESLEKARKSVKAWDNGKYAERVSAARALLNEAEKLLASGRYAEAVKKADAVIGSLNIAIDGNLKDWIGIKPLDAEVMLQGNKGGPQIQKIYMAEDDENYYIAISFGNGGATPHINLIVMNGAETLREYDISLRGDSAAVYRCTGDRDEILLGDAATCYDVSTGSCEVKVAKKLIKAEGEKVVTGTSFSGKPHWLEGDSVKFRYGF